MPESPLKMLEVRRPPGKEPETLLLRLFVPQTDLEPLAHMLSVAEEHLAGLRKTIIKGYRRFPWGFFVVLDRQGRLVANLQVGFFKPWWLVMAMGRQPLALPALVSRILAGLGLLDKFHVANIYLEQDYRGSGLADLLMDFAESLARENWHRKKITLLVSADNLTALKLYRRRGYLETGVFRKDRIEKLEMTRSLY